MNIATHNGCITIANPATGGHRTFRIRTQKSDSNFAPGERIVSLLTGSNNENDYQGFGFVKDDGRIILWRRYRDSGPWSTYADMLRKPEAWKDRCGVEYISEGRCRVCNRKLTTKSSVESGIGPVCAERNM